jgi:hypothetical protein
VTPPVALPQASDPVATAAFVARHGGRVVAYLDEVTTPERALRGAGEAFAALRVRLTSPDPDDDTFGRALLSATRSAAARCAWRGLPGGEALETVVRLLVARHADGLDPGDRARLAALLRESPAARELASGFDRAEHGYARGRQSPLTGTDVDAIATAMALAVAPSGPGGPDAAVRRTAIPARPALPDADLGRAEDEALGQAEDEPPGRAEDEPPGRAEEQAPAPPADADRSAAGATTGCDDDTGARNPPGPSPTGGPDDPAQHAPTTPSADTSGALVRAPRTVLDSPVVRQLGVPALLLVAVVIAALVAAGAFSGRRDEGAPPVPRSTTPTVPSDPRAIPPLP